VRTYCTARGALGVDNYVRESWRKSLALRHADAHVAASEANVRPSACYQPVTRVEEISGATDRRQLRGASACCQQRVILCEACFAKLVLSLRQLSRKSTVMSVSSVTSANAPAPAHKPLMKAADGDYTAASIAANPGSAVGKIKEADGDYRLAVSATAHSAPAVQAALTELKKGG
jgi:hypothetical protein